MDKQPELPSIKIDSILCDLVAKINNFSDDNFDAFWLKLNDSEVETLTILILQILTNSLRGLTLNRLLSAIRSSTDENDLFQKFDIIIVERDSN